METFESLRQKSIAAEGEATEARQIKPDTRGQHGTGGEERVDTPWVLDSRGSLAAAPSQAGEMGIKYEEVEWVPNPVPTGAQEAEVYVWPGPAPPHIEAPASGAVGEQPEFVPSAHVTVEPTPPSFDMPWVPDERDKEPGYYDR